MERTRTRVAAATRALIQHWSVKHQHPERPGTRPGERGQGLAEYSLILAGIAIATIASTTFLGTSINEQVIEPVGEAFATLAGNGPDEEADIPAESTGMMVRSCWSESVGVSYSVPLSMSCHEGDSDFGETYWDPYFLPLDEGLQQIAT